MNIMLSKLLAAIPPPEAPVSCLIESGPISLNLVRLAGLSH